jgi:nicotinamide riboside kinase
MKRIVIIGPESTGKTTLSTQLAAYFHCPLVEEYARTYIDRLNRPYTKEDLLEIAVGQLALEDSREDINRPYMFYDTDLRVIKIWSDLRFNEVHPWILRQIDERKYHAYLLMDIDIIWQPDSQREHPEKRKQLYEIYRKELESSAVPFEVISGVGQQRLSNALKSISRLV